MSDYSDLLYLIAAMLVFSLLSMNVASTFRMSNTALVHSEIEYNAISVLQDEVEEIRWLENDAQEQIDSTIGGTYRYESPITKTTTVDGNEIDYTLSGNYKKVTFPDLGIDSYKITLTVTSSFLPEEQRITQTVIKNFAN